jgi:hypothetical protein
MKFDPQRGAARGSALASTDGGPPESETYLPERT